MSNNLTFYLLLTPEQEELLDDIHAIAQGLLGLDPGGWEPAHEKNDSVEGRLWVAEQGSGRITMHEPVEAQGTRVARSGWIELSGFPDGGKVRWTLSHPAELRIQGLSDSHTDKVWGHQRAQQQTRMRDWITGKIPQRGRSPIGHDKGGFRNLFGGLLQSGSDTSSPPVKLARVAKPGYAPDGTAQWLYAGTLSNLGRYVPGPGCVIGSVAHPEQTSRRLLLRPYQRQGWQTLVPLFFLPQGHRFAGGPLERTFHSVKEIADALYTALGRYARYEISRPKDPVRRKTDPEVLYLARFDALEQSHPDPFTEMRSIARTPGKPVRLRTLETRTSSGIMGRPSGLIEYHMEGLPDASQVFVTGSMVEGDAYQCRAFCTGPREKVGDLSLLVENALK